MHPRHRCSTSKAAALLEGLAKESTKPLAPAVRVDRRIDRVLRVGAAVQPAVRHDGLRHDLAAWLDDLDQARVTAEDTYPPGVAQRLVYVLLPLAKAGKSSVLGVRPISTRLLKSGLFSENDRSYPIEQMASGAEAKFLRPADVRILGDIGRRSRASPYAAMPACGVSPVITEGGFRIWHRMSAKPSSGQDMTASPSTDLTADLSV